MSFPIELSYIIKRVISKKQVRILIEYKGAIMCQRDAKVTLELDKHACLPSIRICSFACLQLNAQIRDG